MFEKLNELKSIHETAMKQIKASGEGALKEALREFFEKFLNVAALRWSQYTPYFNDGDSCTFSVNEPRLRFIETPDDDESGDYEDGYLSTWDLHDKPEHKELLAAFEEFGSVIQSDSMEAVLLAMFGDHVEVTATRDKIEADSYSHD